MSLEQQIAGLAALEEPVRRSLYFYVAGARCDVSRDQAAQACGITRGLAGFHLDKLAEEGLLEVSFRRLKGRAGPGAGRPSKLYRKSERDLEVSLPARQYELAAKVLAAALTEGKDAAVAAEEIGRQMAADRPAAEVLANLGYEPERDGDEIRMRNCPFHALVADHKQLVCGLNLGLIRGLLPGCEARLAPQPGYCCVSVRLTGPS